MKKIIISLVGFLVLQSSCSLLDIEPKTQWSFDNAPTEYSHLEGLLYGGYDRLATALQQNFLYWGEMRGDSFHARAATAYTVDKVIHSNLDMNMSQANWNNLYAVIKQANTCLYFAPRMVDDGIITAAQANRISGQAYAMRAFAYFWIIRVWGEEDVWTSWSEPDEQETEEENEAEKNPDNKMGAPIVEVPMLSTDENVQLPRSSTKKVFRQIHRDLNKAISLLPAQTAPSSVTFGRNACYAIKAQAFMWQKLYAEAIAQINKISSIHKLAALYDPSIVPEDNSSFRTSVIAQTEFSLMFNSTNVNIPEAIFALSFSEGDGDQNNHFYSWYTSSNPYLSARKALAEKYDKADLRLYATVNAYTTTGRVEPLKMTMNYERGLPRDIVLIRWGELLLLRAEAKIRLANQDPTTSQRDDIMLDINQIRVRAQGPSGEIPAQTNANAVGYLDKAAYPDKNSFLDLLKEERLKELLFEGYRWFDLVRWGDAVEVLANLEPELNGTWYFDTGAVTLNPLAIPWPIHINELRRSPKIVQNVYYR